MKKTLLAAVAATCLITAYSTPSEAMNCVAYVRSVTGFDLSGNAYQWWNSAAGVYARGHRPEPGAVMVFSRTRGMRDGHVAVVRQVRNSREILIDHANWTHGGAVSHAQSVIDVSPNNDWSMVRVEWQRTGSYGRINPVNGFIYGDGDSHGAITSARYLTTRKAAADLEPCVEPVRLPHHGHVYRSTIAAKKHHGAQAHLVAAAFHPGAVHLGDARHHGVQIDHAVADAAAKKPQHMVKLRSLVYTTHAIAQHQGPRIVKVSVRTQTYNQHHGVAHVAAHAKAQPHHGHVTVAAHKPAHGKPHVTLTAARKAAKPHLQQVAKAD